MIRFRYKKLTSSKLGSLLYWKLVSDKAFKVSTFVMKVCSAINIYLNGLTAYSAYTKLFDKKSTKPTVINHW